MVTGLSSSDKEIFEHLRMAFDRPAFKVPYQRELDIRDLSKAISDTILAVNTGMIRTRDGHVLAEDNSKSKGHIRDSQFRYIMDDIEMHLINIQTALREGDMRRNFIKGSYVDEEGNYIIDSLNSIFKKLEIPTLPIYRPQR
jgi:hypothetical protein